MSLIGLVIWLLVIGVILYLITLLPVDARLKQVATIVVILIAILWLIQAFLPGIWLHNPRIN
jgi:hypothetical protein